MTLHLLNRTCSIIQIYRIISNIKGLRPLPPTPGIVAWGGERGAGEKAMIAWLVSNPKVYLARLRQRERRHRHAAILEDVRKEIQEIHEARQTSTRAEGPKTDTAHSSNQQLAVGPDTVTPQLYTYICPHCAKSVQSKVATGQIDHRRGDGCGHKFRVANGLLAGRTHTHTCPTCSAVVHSTKASGRIQVTHRTPNGKQCPTNHWHVHS